MSKIINVVYCLPWSFFLTLTYYFKTHNLAYKMFLVKIIFNLSFSSLKDNNSFVKKKKKKKIPTNKISLLTLSEQQRHKLNFKESFPTWVYKLITILMLKLVKMYTSIYTLIINISTIYFTKTSLPWQLLQIFNQIIEIVYTKKLKNFESSLYGTRFVSYNWSYCFSSFLAILTFSIWRMKQYLQIIIQIRVLQG